MWTLVFMEADKGMIDDICSVLEESKIIFRLREVDKEETCDDTCYEIISPTPIHENVDAEVFKAQELIFELEIN